MIQFDVCPTGSGGRQLVIVLQHAHLSDLTTVVVAPLYTKAELPPFAHLRPIVRVGRKEYVMAVDRLFAVPAKTLGVPVGNLEPSRFEISRALDLVFAGF